MGGPGSGPRKGGGHSNQGLKRFTIKGGPKIDLNYRAKAIASYKKDLAIAKKSRSGPAARAELKNFKL
jgi:hypothetical protein